MLERAILLLTGGVAVVALVVAATMGISEAGPFLARADSLDARVAAFTDSAYPPRVAALASPYAHTASLDLCLNTLREVSGKVTTLRESIAALNRGCLRVAESFAAVEPLAGNPWYIAAALAYRTGDMPRVERYLERSYAIAPNEQWIAERRALFAYGIRDRLAPDLQAKTDIDFRLLFHTYTGTQALARAYIDDPNGLGAHLTGIAASLDQPTQRQFVSLVREALSRRQEAPSD